MAVQVKDDTFSVGTSLLAIPVGITLALYCPQLAGRNSVELRYVAGGTLCLIGVAPGTTLTAAQLDAQAGGYYISTVNSLRIPGPAAFYLGATGATVLVSQLTSFSPGV